MTESKKRRGREAEEQPSRRRRTHRDIDTHPALRLQRHAGNRAAERLLTVGHPSEPSPLTTAPVTRDTDGDSRRTLTNEAELAREIESGLRSAKGHIDEATKRLQQGQRLTGADLGEAVDALGRVGSGLDRLATIAGRTGDAMEFADGLLALERAWAAYQADPSQENLAEVRDAFSTSIGGLSGATDLLPRGAQEYAEVLLQGADVAIGGFSDAVARRTAQADAAYRGEDPSAVGRPPEVAVEPAPSAAQQSIDERRAYEEHLTGRSVPLGSIADAAGEVLRYHLDETRRFDAQTARLQGLRHVPDRPESTEDSGEALLRLLELDEQRLISWVESLDDLNIITRHLGSARSDREARIRSITDLMLERLDALYELLRDHRFTPSLWDRLVPLRDAVRDVQNSYGGG